MSLFNFGEDDNNRLDFDWEENYEEEQERYECQCYDCSQEHTYNLIGLYTEDILNSKNISDLQDNLFKFAEMVKIQGIREYLFAAIEAHEKSLVQLDNYTEEDIL